MSGKRGTKRRITPVYVGPIPKKRRTAKPTVSTGRITRRYMQGGSKVRKVLRYYEQFTLNPGPAGTPANYIWRGNCIRDPRHATGGHQARGFDQYMAMYDHFTVTKCTAKVYFDNNAEASGCLGVIHVRDSATVISSQSGIMEYGMKTVVKLPASNVGAGGGDLPSGTIAVDIGKFLGIKDILDAREAAGTAAASPTEEVMIHVSAFPINTGDAAPINAAVELEYEVVFHEPKNPAES